MQRKWKSLCKSALAIAIATCFIVPSNALLSASKTIETKEAKTYKCGDINFDDILDISDVAIGRSFIVGNSDFTALQYKVGDMNNDGSFDISDIVLMRSIIVGNADGSTVTIGDSDTDPTPNPNPNPNPNPDPDPNPDPNPNPNPDPDPDPDPNPDPDPDPDPDPYDKLDTKVTDSTIDNFEDYEGQISNVDINGDKLYSQNDFTKDFGSFGNLYDRSLYDNNSGSKVGIVFCGWNKYNYLEDPDLNYKMNYFGSGSSYGFERMTFIPTYYLDTYSEGIQLNNINTLSPDEQANIISAALKKGVRMNYRLHIDPYRFSPEGISKYSTVNTSIPGSQWWRGEFTEVNPMSSDYIAMINEGFETLEKTFAKTGNITLAEPIRFDIGAELMTSVKLYTQEWCELVEYCKAKRDASPALKDNVIIGYNFCHHIEYLIEMEGHSDYFGRINGTGVTYKDRQDLLFVDDMPEENRKLLGDFIKSLDSFSISQYMPMDMFASADLKSTNVATTAQDVCEALLTHEQNFLQKVLIGKLGIAPDEIPPFHLGEYGMGIKGLTAPNVWDRTAWQDSELATYEAQQRHAEIAMAGLMLYMSDERSVAQSLALWISGAPYDVINFYPGMNTGDAGHGYPGKSAYNANAAAVLKDYLADGKLDVIR